MIHYAIRISLSSIHFESYSNLHILSYLYVKGLQVHDQGKQNMLGKEILIIVLVLVATKVSPARSQYNCYVTAATATCKARMYFKNDHNVEKLVFVYNKLS